MSGMLGLAGAVMSFKPCYKWNTFNTGLDQEYTKDKQKF